jgi:hypothetical protein
VPNRIFARAEKRRMIKKNPTARRDSSRIIKTYYEKTCIQGNNAKALFATYIYGTAENDGKR